MSEVDWFCIYPYAGSILLYMQFFLGAYIQRDGRAKKCEYGAEQEMSFQEGHELVQAKGIADKRL